MDIKKLLKKPGDELTKKEFDTVFQFKRSIHKILLNHVEGDTLKEKYANIEKLTFDDRVDIALQYYKK